MKAIRYNATIPRYAAGLALSKLSTRFLWSGLSCTTFDDVPEPSLPGDDWAVIKTRYGGICGSDMSAILLHSSPYFSPLTSFPFTFGHENIGRIAVAGSAADDWRQGERVIAEPVLWCAPRGFEDLCRYCIRGEINRCERITEGALSPGLFTGYCRDTGGSWSEYFLAHKSQLNKVPDQVSDENGLMVEPFAVGLHAALNNFPGDDEAVLLIGAGTIGLCTLAALRVLGSKSEISVLARHPFQAEAAHKLGASRVIPTGHGEDYYAEIAEITGAKLLKPVLGKRLVLGGFDRVFECVGSDRSLDDSFRFTRNGGKVVLVGVPGISKDVDWSAIFASELELKAAYIYNHAENYSGRTWKTFDLALDLMSKGELDLSWMVTHKFALGDYRQALQFQTQRAKNHSIRSVFSFED